jgi:hypothetical protein
MLLGAFAVLAGPAIAATSPPLVTSVCRVGLAKPQCLLGPVAGGYQVAISGSNLAGATQVSFGRMKAPSFTVDSPTLITAVVPRSTLFGWHAQGVSVRVTTPAGTSPRCGVLQAGCSSAFFYAKVTSLAASGRNVSKTFSGSAGSFAYSGTVTIGSWAVGGSVQTSGNIAPEAVLALGKLSMSKLSVHLTVSGGVAPEIDIPLPLPGLPSIAGAYLRLIPGLQGQLTVDDAITGDSVSLTLGWVNGAAYHRGTAACDPSGCFGKPVRSTAAAGSLIAGPWLQIGSSFLKVGIGPEVGLFDSTTHVSDACAGIQAEASVDLLRIKRTYNVYGPFNLSGTFADCPL